MQDNLKSTGLGGRDVSNCMQFNYFLDLEKCKSQFWGGHVTASTCDKF